MSENYLPLILVSALDLATASKLISGMETSLSEIYINHKEIIDNEVTDSDRKQRNGRVWRLVNKYYRADVELCPAPDGAPLPPAAELLEAHVICVTEQGAAAAAAAEARRAAHGAGAAVRLVLAPGARLPGALAAWARRCGYEPVALAERAEPAADSPPDAVGVQRVRDALHAHAWRGLQHAHTGVGEAEAEGAVERAEAFAAALGALAAARDAPPADDAERRRRAERVVAAFCRALGAEPPLL